jgi:hypothetical protein
LASFGSHVRNKPKVRLGTNKPGRLEAVVAAEACLPILLGGGFGFDPFDFGATAMTKKTTLGTTPEIPSNLIRFPKSRKRGRKRGPQADKPGAPVVALKPRPCVASARPLTAEDVQDLAVARELLQQISNKLWRDARNTEASKLAYVADKAVRDLWFAAFEGGK